MWRTIADMAIYDYDGRSACRTRGITQRFLDAIEIVGIPYTNDIPSVGEKPAGDIFGERDIGFTFDGDVIVVVNPAKVIELQVPCNRGGLARDSFHHAAVAAERENPILDQLKIRTFESPPDPFFSLAHPTPPPPPLPHLPAGSSPPP